jgi:hypothetical protein
LREVHEKGLHAMSPWAALSADDEAGAHNAAVHLTVVCPTVE